MLTWHCRCLDSVGNENNCLEVEEAEAPEPDQLDQDPLRSNNHSRSLLRVILLLPHTCTAACFVMSFLVALVPVPSIPSLVHHPSFQHLSVTIPYPIFCTAKPTKHHWFFFCCTIKQSNDQTGLAFTLPFTMAHIHTLGS